MAEKPLRKNELGVIALLSGMIRQYKETNTLDDVHNLICKTSDEILDICEGETPKQNESNFSIPVVIGSTTMYKAVFSFKKSHSSGGLGRWVKEIEIIEAKNEAELKEKIAAYTNNDHCGYHEYIKLVSINSM